MLMTCSATCWQTSLNSRLTITRVAWVAASAPTSDRPRVNGAAACAAITSAARMPSWTIAPIFAPSMRTATPSRAVAAMRPHSPSFLRCVPLILPQWAFSASIGQRAARRAHQALDGGVRLVRAVVDVVGELPHGRRHLAVVVLIHIRPRHTDDVENLIRPPRQHNTHAKHAPR